MATADITNIVKRVDVNRKLTYLEMDANFEELKRIITDLIALEGNTATIDDTLASNTTAWSSTKVLQEINASADELVDDTIINPNKTWSSEKLDLELGAVDTAITNTNTELDTKLNLAQAHAVALSF